MKIIDAPIPKSKSAQMREAIKQIAGKNKAALLESESDLKLFRCIVRKMGFRTFSLKLNSGGWNVWIIDSNSSTESF